MAGLLSSILKRIKIMLNFRKPTQMFIILAVVLAVALSVGFALTQTTGTTPVPLNDTALTPETAPTGHTAPTEPAPDSPSSAAAGSQKLIAKADLNREVGEEGLYLDQSQKDSGFITLRVLDGSGREIWSESASTAHAGWTSLFLLQKDGEYFLLRYLPGMWQGYCSYTYTLFALADGKEQVVRSNTIDFDVNGVKPLDALQMIAFADEVNALLSQSTLLISSEGGNYSLGPSVPDPFLERYSWLDGNPRLYDANDDLETRLVKYSEYTVANHRG